MTYLDLPIAQIDANPGQPRKSFNADKLRELSESIAALGLLEPVLVRPDGDRWLLIAGERRWRAARMAGLEVIPARVMDLGEIDAYVLSVAENVNRDDMTPMEESRAFAQLRTYGKPDAEIARVFGKRVDVVRDRMRLLDCLPEIQELIDRGDVSVSLGWYLARLKPGNQRTVANRLARGELDHAGACEFADALGQAEQEVGFFAMEEPTEEERMFHVKRQRAIRSTTDQIDRLSALLSDLTAADPADLSRDLGNDVSARLDAIERIARQATAAAKVLRKAKAHAEARTLVIAEDVA